MLNRDVPGSSPEIFKIFSRAKFQRIIYLKIREQDRLEVLNLFFEIILNSIRVIILRQIVSLNKSTEPLHYEDLTSLLSSTGHHAVVESTFEKLWKTYSEFLKNDYLATYSRLHYELCNLHYVIFKKLSPKQKKQR